MANLRKISGINEYKGRNGTEWLMDKAFARNVIFHTSFLTPKALTFRRKVFSFEV